MKVPAQGTEVQATMSRTEVCSWVMSPPDSQWEKMWDSCKQRDQHVQRLGCATESGASGKLRIPVPSARNRAWGEESHLEPSFLGLCRPWGVVTRKGTQSGLIFSKFPKGCSGKIGRWREQWWSWRQGNQRGGCWQFCWARPEWWQGGEPSLQASLLYQIMLKKKEESEGPSLDCFLFVCFSFSSFIFSPWTSGRMEMEKLNGGSWLCVGGMSEVDFWMGLFWDVQKCVCLCVSHRHLDKHVCSFGRGLGWRYSKNFRCSPGHSQGIRFRGGNLKVISSGPEVTEGGAGD